jgi:hypothetical protein
MFLVMLCLPPCDVPCDVVLAPGPSVIRGMRADYRAYNARVPCAESLMPSCWLRRRLRDSCFADAPSDCDGFCEVGLAEELVDVLNHGVKRWVFPKSKFVSDQVCLCRLLHQITYACTVVLLHNRLHVFGIQNYTSF